MQRTVSPASKRYSRSVGSLAYVLMRSKYVSEWILSMIWDEVLVDCKNCTFCHCYASATQSVSLPAPIYCWSIGCCLSNMFLTNCGNIDVDKVCQRANHRSS